MGAGSSEIDFFIVGRAFLHLYQDLRIVESAVATHSAVVLELEAAGAKPLAEWVRPKAQSLERVYGPQLQASGACGASLPLPQWCRAEELCGSLQRWLATRLGGRTQCFGVLRGVPGLQADLDWFWDRWLELAKVEVAANSGQLLQDAAAQPYTFREFDPFARLKTGCSKVKGSELPKASYVVGWALRRVQECNARIHDCRWELVRPRHAAKLLKWLPAAPQLRELQVVQFIARPWDFPGSKGIELAESCKELLAQLRSEERRLSRSTWQDKLDAAAVAGTKPAFLHLKGADVVGPPTCNTAGTHEVLEQHARTWGGLWQADVVDPREPRAASSREAAWRARFPDDVRCEAIPVAELRASAASFAPGTSCPDGLPAKALTLLSDDTLEVLSRMGAVWEAAGTWPSLEAAAMTVMIPKVTSEGERPITLFRTVVRVMAKAKSWRAAGWLEDNSPEYLNMARGRRVGDGMWRTQLRALISEEQGQQSNEVMLDLHKAFELVQRDKLLEAGILAGYPLDALI